MSLLQILRQIVRPCPWTYGTPCFHTIPDVSAQALRMSEDF
jgi:hypothetical protein